MKSAAARFVFGFFSLVSLVLVFTQYQNCSGSGGGGSGFNISTSNTPAITVSAPSLNLATFTPGQPLLANALVSGGNGNITCQWAIYTNPGGNIVPPPLPSNPAVNGICYLSANAPTALGNYNLTVTAVDGVDTPAVASSGFSVANVQATPTPQPTPTPGPTPTPKPTPTPGPTPTPTPTPTPKPTPTPVPTPTPPPNSATFGCRLLKNACPGGGQCVSCPNGISQCDDEMAAKCGSMFPCDVVYGYNQCH
jgi:hypothetical protein